MLEVLVTREFENLYGKLPLDVKQKFEKQERFFRENLFHPSLHTEKLEPKGREIWSFRIDLNYRVLFRFFKKNSVILLVVGRHDWIYRLRF